MERKDDIEFMNSFRENIDRYLFLGYAPPVDSEAHEYDGAALDKMNAQLQKKEFQELRRTISGMTPRAKSLLAQCGVTPIIVNYPPPPVGGPVAQLSVFTINDRIKTPIDKIGDGKHVWKYVIPATAKTKIAADLERLRISKFQLFPELDNIGET